MTTKEKSYEIINKMKEGNIYTIHDYVGRNIMVYHYWYEDGVFYENWEDCYHEPQDIEISEARLISNLEMMIINPSRYKIWYTK